MNNKEISNAGYLLMLDNSYEEFYRTPLGFLWKHKLNKFWVDNGETINNIKARRKELGQEYLVFDENWKPILIDDEETGKKKVKLKEEIRRKEYNDKFMALMNEQVEIII